MSSPSSACLSLTRPGDDSVAACDSALEKATEMIEAALEKEERSPGWANVEWNPRRHVPRRLRAKVKEAFAERVTGRRAERGGRRSSRLAGLQEWSGWSPPIDDLIQDGIYANVFSHDVAAGDLDADPSRHSPRGAAAASTSASPASTSDTGRRAGRTVQHGPYCLLPEGDGPLFGEDDSLYGYAGAMRNDTGRTKRSENL